MVSTGKYTNFVRCRDLGLVEICKSVPARREGKRICATFTNPVERGWESAGGFVKSAKIRRISEDPVLLKVLGGAWGFGLSPHGRKRTVLVAEAP